MIRYSLKCADAHSFESWFASADAFEKLLGAGMVTCPECGTGKVEKAIMAPRVRPSRGKAEKPAETRPIADAPVSEKAAALAEIRKQVEENSDYVGMSFAAEARKMHDGEIPQRSIYGEARGDEAKKLIEDGIPVAPLPFIPQRKTN